MTKLEIILEFADDLSQLEFVGDEYRKMLMKISLAFLNSEMSLPLDEKNDVLGKIVSVRKKIIKINKS